MKRRNFLKGTAALAAAGAVPLSAARAIAKTETGGPMLSPWTGSYGGYPPFDKVVVAEFKTNILAAMDLMRAQIAAIAASKAKPDFENTVTAYADAGRELDRVRRIFNIWTSTLKDKAVRGIEAEMSPVNAAFNDEIIQNGALFARLKAVYEARAKGKLTAEQQRLCQIIYENFVRQGAALGPEQKARLKEVNQKLAKVRTQFAQNALYDEESQSIILDNEADLAGLSDALRSAAAASAEAKGHKGKWLIANTRSSAEPFLTFSTRRDLRQKVFEMWSRRGEIDAAHDNRPLITEIVKLRAARAELLGFGNFADAQLANNMAKTPDAAIALMMKVWKPAVERVRQDVAAMQAIADKEAANFKIEAWDYRFYAEKLRQASYELDEDEVKQYLQLDKIREAMFWAAGQVYGLSFAKVEGLPVAQADITTYQVTRGKDFVGLWYFDPYARDGKNSGAWMNEYRSPEHFRDKVTAIVSNNTNFIKTAPGQPILISWDDAVTMFHEFGHALHGLQYQGAYQGLGLQSVKRDFVEFPSQVNERWLPTKEVLGRFALHHKTGQPMPDAMVERIMRARTFNQGFTTVEYLSSALYDMKIHLAARPDKDIDPSAFEKEVLAEIGMPKEIIMRHRPPHFGHSFSGEGYSAGYYVYIWADTMAADASEAFSEAGSFYDRATCDRFRKTIFEVGNAVAPEQAFRNFRGRDVDTNALMRARGFPVA